MTPRRRDTSVALHHLLLDAGREAPTSVAVIDITGTGEPVARTYGELVDRAERFASVLKQCGHSRGDRIVVDAVTCAATIAMLMACSMVGATFVPLSPEVPDQRAQQIVGLSRPHGYAHIVSAGRLGRLNGHGQGPIGAVAFSWDECSITASRPATAGRETNRADEALAYLIFTSGSTGVPKGVAMRQRATSAFFDATRGMLRSTDRVASTAPLQFDFCLLDIGMCLANSCAIVPIPRSCLRWPRRIVEGLAATGCTRVHAVPSVWRPLLRREPQLLTHLPPLDAVMFSGETFPPEELAILHRALPATRIVNCYGPTECMACSFTDVTAFADGSAVGLPIDNSYPGSALAIIADDGTPIRRPGRSGQICFTGPSVLAGYWTRDAVPCRPDTVRTRPDGSLCLLTGDYGHIADDGRLRFDGRRDRQVKVGGNRVELAEIEATLCQVQGIDEACVVADADGGPVSLVAFVGGSVADHVAQEEACRQQCIDKLPLYMRPAKIVHLMHLPKSANGKVDQYRLADEAGSRRSHQRENV